MKNNYSKNIFGITGKSGTGKTYLISKLIPEIKKNGLIVSTIKHAHHGFEIDNKKKDSYKHRQSGANEVLIFSSKGWALIQSMQTQQDSNLVNCIDKMTDVDLIIAEGFKSYNFKRIEIVDSSDNLELAEKENKIVGLVSKTNIYHPRLPVFHRDDISRIAKFILHACDIDVN